MATAAVHLNGLLELANDIDGPVLLGAIMSIARTVCGIPIERPMGY
jgi:hypothetical protein